MIEMWALCGRIVRKFLKSEDDDRQLPQCEAISSSSAEFNCCIKPAGHKGMHVSADGNKWF